MDDVSVILHSGMVSAIICCVSHNLKHKCDELVTQETHDRSQLSACRSRYLSSAVRKLHGVLTLRLLLGLAL